MKLINTQSNQKNLRLVPTFAVCEKELALNGKAFSLFRKPLMLKLLRVFVSSPNCTIPKKQLLGSVYTEYFDRKRSDRFRKNTSHNLNKLISRTRLLMDREFNAEVRWIDFFVYDHLSDGWSLYRLRNEYIENQVEYAVAG